MKKCDHELKSLVPKSNKSTFGTSEKNRFLWRNFIHISMGKKNLEEKKTYLRELSGSNFHSVTSSNVILYNDVKNSIFIKSGFIWFWNLALQYAVKAQTSLAPLSRFRGSRITTAHEQQCCSFQSYARTMPSQMKLTRKLTKREPHSWDPWQQTTWSRRVTSDFNSVLWAMSLFVISSSSISR